MVKQCILNVNYGLSNFNQHKLWEANPLLKKKVKDEKVIK